MTTVGCGDKAPTTPLGRGIATGRMFASAITISSLTAAIASTRTTSRLEVAVGGPSDLPSLGRIVCVEDSTREAYLRGQQLSYVAVGDVREGLGSLAGGRYRAMVYDAPILRFTVSEGFAALLDLHEDDEGGRGMLRRPGRCSVEPKQA